MQAFQISLAVIFLIVLVISGLLAGALVRGIAYLLGHWGIPLQRYRGWLALVAVAGCFAWYPLQGIFSMKTYPVSVVFATGMCIAILW